MISIFNAFYCICVGKSEGLPVLYSPYCSKHQQTISYMEYSTVTKQLLVRELSEVAEASNSCTWCTTSFVESKDVQYLQSCHAPMPTTGTKVHITLGTINTYTYIHCVHCHASLYASVKIIQLNEWGCRDGMHHAKNRRNKVIP